MSKPKGKTVAEEDSYVMSMGNVKGLDGEETKEKPRIWTFRDKSRLQRKKERKD